MSQKRGPKRLDRAVSCISDGHDGANGDVCPSGLDFSFSSAALHLRAVVLSSLIQANRFSGTLPTNIAQMSSLRKLCAFPWLTAPVHCREPILKAFACAHRQECDVELF